jgi:hypothetical protein
MPRRGVIRFNIIYRSSIGCIPTRRTICARLLKTGSAKVVTLRITRQYPRLRVPSESGFLLMSNCEARLNQLTCDEQNGSESLEVYRESGKRETEWRYK